MLKQENAHSEVEHDEEDQEDYQEWASMDVDKFGNGHE